MVQDLTLALAVRLQAWLRGEQGQTLAEYGLILAVISVFIVGGSAVFLGEQITATFEEAAACVDGSC